MRHKRPHSDSNLARLRSNYIPLITKHLFKPFNSLCFVRTRQLIISHLGNQTESLHFSYKLYKLTIQWVMSPNVCGDLAYRQEPQDIGKLAPCSVTRMLDHGALYWKEVKAYICHIIKQIWLLPFIPCLYCFVSS